jgi:hypothetical protein
VSGTIGRAVSLLASTRGPASGAAGSDGRLTEHAANAMPAAVAPAPATSAIR